MVHPMPYFSSVVRTSEIQAARSLGKAALRYRSEEHTSELQSRLHLVCRLLLEKKKNRAVLHRTTVLSLMPVAPAPPTPPTPAYTYNVQLRHRTHPSNDIAHERRYTPPMPTHQH